MVEIAILASTELQKKRLLICESCEHYKNKFNINVCDICGCAMKMKIKIQQLKCPKGKW